MPDIGRNPGRNGKNRTTGETPVDTRLGGVPDRNLKVRKGLGSLPSTVCQLSNHTTCQMAVDHIPEEDCVRGPGDLPETDAFDAFGFAETAAQKFDFSP